MRGVLACKWQLYDVGVGWVWPVKTSSLKYGVALFLNYVLLPTLVCLSFKTFAQGALEENFFWNFYNYISYWFSGLCTINSCEIVKQMTYNCSGVIFVQFAHITLSESGRYFEFQAFWIERFISQKIHVGI